MARETFVAALADSLDSTAMTVRAQALPPDDNGRLNWDVFFPRRDVDSMKVRDMVTTEFRVAMDRRDWNQRGRLYAPITPAIRELEFVPIEGYFKVAEKEQYDLAVAYRGNQEVMLDAMNVRIEERQDAIALGTYYRLEVDDFDAWATGTITAKDPQTGATYLMDFGFDASRYDTAGTAWDNVGVNAYNEALAFLIAAEDAMGGPPRGLLTRRTVVNAIVADAPEETVGIARTRRETEELLSDQIGSPIVLRPMENQVKVYTDGGLATTDQKIWPAGIAAAIPPDGIVGYSGFAPVLRAIELAGGEGGQLIDENGVTVVRGVDGEGRGLTVEAQLNAFPVPDENKLFVIDTLIA